MSYKKGFLIKEISNNSRVGVPKTSTPTPATDWIITNMITKKKFINSCSIILKFTVEFKYTILIEINLKIYAK